MTHKFVDKIPETIEEGILYVSIPYETVIHKCCCGCGSEVVTPISPTDWILTFDGDSITLDPSIGSWSLDCRSHYYIRKNKVVWSNTYSSEEVYRVRKIDIEDKLNYFDELGNDNKSLPKGVGDIQPPKRNNGLLDWFKRVFNKK
ncbi:MAG: hypothetical protein KAH72_01360 [Flavobacteriaceae bacterium]|nr:hypothetical protein [Flavobacteriaceae bacterium]